MGRREMEHGVDVGSESSLCVRGHMPVPIEPCDVKGLLTWESMLVGSIRGDCQAPEPPTSIPAYSHTCTLVHARAYAHMHTSFPH